MSSTITESAIRKLLVEYCASRKQGDIAKELGISQQYLSLMLRGARRVSKKVALTLGYRKITQYIKSEISER